MSNENPTSTPLPIFFNSKSTNEQPWWQLSNFYDVECAYQANKFSNPVVRDWFKKIEDMPLEEFLSFMRDFFDKKKPLYWTRKIGKDERRPIYGIIAKMVSNRLTKQKPIKFIKKFSSLLNVTAKEAVERNLGFHDEKYLKECMENKFKIPKYARLLKSTGKRRLHERQMRGKGDKWTRDAKGRGENKMGFILEQIRNKMNEESNEASN